MRRHFACWLLPAALALAAATAAAQGAPSPRSSSAAADPLDATAKVAPQVYKSALGTYKRLDVNEPLPWREANDRVRCIGGWRTYAREANAPEAPASAPPSPQPGAEAGSMPMSKPVPDPHVGHKMH